jgi:hypothetical protein
VTGPGCRSSRSCAGVGKTATCSCGRSICSSSTARTCGASRSRSAKPRSPACCDRAALAYSSTSLGAAPRHRLPPRVQDGPRRHRLEAAGVALHQRPLARLAQVQEPNAPAVKREAEEDGVKKGFRGRQGASPAGEFFFWGENFGGLRPAARALRPAATYRFHGPPDTARDGHCVSNYVGRRRRSGFYGLTFAAFVLFGQLAPLSGDLLQTFLRVTIRRSLGLLFCLCRMLAVSFGSRHGRFPPCRINPSSEQVDLPELDGPTAG